LGIGAGAGEGNSCGEDRTASGGGPVGIGREDCTYHASRKRLGGTAITIHSAAESIDTSKIRKNKFLKEYES
jgi:hypothetical protein